RFANRSARFVSAYDQGLSGSEAAWINKDYHGHRTLPPVMARWLGSMCRYNHGLIVFFSSLWGSRNIKLK
ncbi:hypothetical protein B0H10DRAFT_1772955, partial [Mycena sp. CBHHK59/15]